MDAATAIPIFPLNTILFPGGLLPLKIFEQRYLEMTKACLRDNTPFGVCRIREGHEVGTPATYEPIGCTARIAEWDMPHLGLFHLRTVGEQPFRVSRAHVEAGGLIRAEIDRLEDIPGELDPDAFERCQSALRGIATRVGTGYFAGPPAFEEPGWVGYRLAELLPLATEDRQRLLEQRDTALRLSRIADLLQSA